MFSLYIYENYVVVSSVEMRIMIGVVVFLFFVCLLFLVIVSKNFKVNLFYDDKLFNDFLVLESFFMFVFYCVCMCGLNCRYYGFNFKIKKCRVYICFILVKFVEEEGWRYYFFNDLDYKCKLI